MTGVILFRAQPFHNGHMHTIKQAFNDCRKNNSDLYVFVGSADKYRTKRNPLPINFRIMLIEGSIKEVFDPQDIAHIHIIPLADMTDETDNSYAWGQYLFIKMLYHTRDVDMTIYYSDNPEIIFSWFEEEISWCFSVKLIERYNGISATQVRNYIIKGEPVDKFVPNFVNNHIDEIREYFKDEV